MVNRQYERLRCLVSIVSIDLHQQAHKVPLLHVLCTVSSTLIVSIAERLECTLKYKSANFHQTVLLTNYTGEV